MEHEKSSALARSLGRAGAVGVVLAVGVLIEWVASAYRWLQILIALWAIPFLALAGLCGGEIGEVVARRLGKAKARIANAAQDATGIDDDASDNSEVPIV
jgi:hypothetical protein